MASPVTQGQTPSAGPAGQAPEENIPWIAAPGTVEETGIRRALLEELVLKTIAREREVTTRALSDILALSPRVVDDLFQQLRKAQFIEVTGMTAGVYRATLTTQGRARADALASTNQYVGPAPVSLEAYDALVRAQAVAKAEVHPEAVRRAFAPLVLDDDFVRRLGIAIASGSSIVLQGPSGTGKTSIAAHIPEVFGRGVFIPYAVELGGEIIVVFDPGAHHQLSVNLPANHDRRWVYCERPFVVAGGELTVEMLDLQFNPVSGYYAAPPQMKANTGVFVIDDFGRQRVRPEELLNRWIVPLDRGLDFLTLHGGSKFAIPFAVLVVFATNLDAMGGFASDTSPGIKDTAFLRRIPNKISVDYASREQFHEIFRRVCADAGLAYDGGLVDRLIDVLANQVREPLRPCIPRDLVRQISWEARYEGTQPEFTAPAVARACQNYFAMSSPGLAAGASGAAGGPPRA
jgi:predicted ATPase with chaperone activity